MRALRRQLRNPAFGSLEQGSYGSSVSESSSSGPEGRATQFVRRSKGACVKQGDVLRALLLLRLLRMFLVQDLANPRSHRHCLLAGLGGLSVEVSEPHDPTRPARFSFRGHPTERDLVLMSATLQSAMQPRRRGPVEVRTGVSCTWLPGLLAVSRLACQNSHELWQPCTALALLLRPHLGTHDGGTPSHRTTAYLDARVPAGVPGVGPAVRGHTLWALL